MLPDLKDFSPIIWDPSMVLPSIVEKLVDKWPDPSYPKPLPLDHWKVVPPIDDVSAVSWAVALDGLTQACGALITAETGKHFKLPSELKNKLRLNEVNSETFRHGLEIVLTDLSFDDHINKTIPNEKVSTKIARGYKQYIEYCQKLRSIAFKTRLARQLLEDVSQNSGIPNRRKSAGEWQDNLEQLEAKLAGRGMILHSGYQTTGIEEGLSELKDISAFMRRYHSGDFIYSPEKIKLLLQAVAGKITHGTGGRYNLAESLRDARRKINNSFIDSRDPKFGQGKLVIKDLVLSGKGTGTFDSVPVELLEYPGTSYVQPISVFDNPFKFGVTVTDPVLVFSKDGNLIVGSDGLPTVIMDRIIYMVDRQGNKIPVRLYSFDKQE